MRMVDVQSMDSFQVLYLHVHGTVSLQNFFESH